MHLLFVPLKLRRDSKEDYVEVGKSKMDIGLKYIIVNRLCFLEAIKVYFTSVLASMPRNQEPYLSLRSTFSKEVMCLECDYPS